MDEQVKKLYLRSKRPDVAEELARIIISHSDKQVREDALVAAAGLGLTDVVKEGLKHGLPPTSSTKSGLTGLMAASRNVFNEELFRVLSVDCLYRICGIVLLSQRV